MNDLINCFLNEILIQEILREVFASNKMAYRCKPKKQNVQMNLDVIAKTLMKVDADGYDHPLLGKVLYCLGSLSPSEQKSVIKVALNIDLTHEQLIDHVKSLFFVLKQKDDIGEYCGLGFGDKCVNVATWRDWILPQHATDVDVAKICYRDSDGTLRCSHLLDFMELFMDVKKVSFEELISELNVE